MEAPASFLFVDVRCTPSARHTYCRYCCVLLFPPYITVRAPRVRQLLYLKAETGTIAPYIRISESRPK